MKNIRVIHFLFILFSVLSFSCTPEKPENAAENRGHEMPNITVYTIQEGTLADDNALGTNNKRRNYLGQGFVPSDKNTQVVKFVQVQKNNGSELEMQGNGFVFKPNVWYKIKIDFLNKSGANINYQYYESEEARKLHQFFFRSFLYEEGKPASRMLNQVTGENNIFDYRYGDTFQNGVLIDPPIGFFGYIRYIGDRANILNGQNKIVLNPFLVHSMASSKLTYDRTNKEWVPFPFDNHGKTIIGISDIDHRIVVTLSN